MIVTTAEQLRALGDENRLRIVRLLRRESLNVGEMMSILGLAQPTVSKHLAELRRVGLVEAERSSGYSFYRLADVTEPWWDRLMTAVSASEDGKRDLVRLTEVLRQRSEQIEVQDRFVVPGRSWLAWARALRFLLPNLVVADLGCGDGILTAEIAAWARHVFAVDCNELLLRTARERAGVARNISFHLESMEELSLACGSVDLVVISQSLHYLETPDRALGEAFRILKPEGRLLVLELLPHNETWVLEQLHHRHLGFEANQLRRWLKEAGFSQVELDTGTKQGPEPFRVVIATAKRADQES